MSLIFKKIREQLMLRFYAFRKETSFLLPELIYIEPTNFCIMKCYMCPSRVGHRKKGMMDIELYEKVIDDLNSYASDNPSQVPLEQLIMLQGQGSSLMSTNILRMIRYAKAKNFKVGLDTTGALLDLKKAEEIIRSELDLIQFSCYGLSKESYFRIHGRDLFYTSFRNIIRFLHLTKRKPTLSVDGTIFDSKRTQTELGFIKYLYSHLPFSDLFHLRIQNFHGIFEELGLHEEVEFIWKKETQKMYHASPIQKAIMSWIRSKSYVRVGPCLWKSTLVQWNGDVTPCVADYSARYVVGNVKDENIVDLWNNEKYRRFRRSIFENDYKSLRNMKFCNYCSYAERVRAPFIVNLLRILLSPHKAAKWLKRQHEGLTSKHERYKFLEKHFPLDEEDLWLENLKCLKNSSMVSAL